MEKTRGGVRVRAFFHDKAWTRFQDAADKLGMDERRIVETCALIGLRALTVSIIDPFGSDEVKQASDAVAALHLEEVDADLVPPQK